MATKGEMIKTVVVAAPNFRSVEFTLVGTAPLVMNKMSEKAKTIMMEAMSSRKGKQRGNKAEPVDWEEKLQGAIHYSTEGWIGFPASAFRAAAISACRIVNFKMTLGKMGIFVRPDGFDKDDGSPLVRLIGEYRPVDHVVRLGMGSATVARRPMFEQWSAKIVVDYDGDMFSTVDLYNLFVRVGLQVGIGEGRPDSKSSVGMGWGTFRIESTKEII